LDCHAGLGARAEAVVPGLVAKGAVVSEARSAILARLQGALADVPAGEDPSSATVERRYRRTLEVSPDQLVDTFAKRVSGYKVTVGRAPRDQAAGQVAEILQGRGFKRILLPPGFPADLEPRGLDLLRDEGLPNEVIASADGVLTLCAVAIAQTGTIVLDHGAGQGRRALTLLPDYHLCLVQGERIVGLVPEAVARTEAAVQAGRPLTFISGPSATSDIELNRVEGVHGGPTVVAPGVV
jgi:L-lactate dehydrogenase complex protein LldG